ncbi:MAG: hydroxymethylbilane synthase [Rhodospirillaceae bacterium]|nr:MAG: hydroxymethylbilane synthase [Rhodospirillaceae bacterium]
MTAVLLRIGTRASPMAVAQTGRVAQELAAANPELAAPGAIELVKITTTGDQMQDRKLSEIGGKALFTKEIEEALIAGEVDIAVHSMKDVPTVLPPGLEIACMLKRDDPRDAVMAAGCKSFDDLPAGATIGTSSLRRAAQVLHRWPQLKVVPYRGNANTRLRKLQEGVVDATILALSGLHRIDRLDVISFVMPVEDMLPAVGQGALGIEIRSNDDRVRNWLAPLRHEPSEICVEAERSLLMTLDGSCRTPIAALAEIDDKGELRLRGLLAQPDGSQLVQGERRGKPGEGVKLGRDLGLELKAKLPITPGH